MTTSLDGRRTAALCRCVAAATSIALAAALAPVLGCGQTDDERPPDWTEGGGSDEGEEPIDDASNDSDGGTEVDGDRDADQGEDADGGESCTEDQTRCLDDGERICNGQDSLARECADGCSDSACAGDRCTEAIAVELPPAGEAITVEGDQQAFSDRWNAEEREGCSLYEDEPAGATEGPEIFLEVSGHSEGDVVEFDARHSSTSFAFYLMDDCEASGCIDAGVHDEDFEYRHRWEATTDAKVWIAAEVFGPERDRSFRIDLRRVE